MKRLVLGAVLITVGSALSADAQSSNDCSTVITQDACQKAVDLYRYMAPQLGTAIAGGNATLGQGGALGGFPHFAIGVRLNAVKGTVPDLESAPPQLGAAQTSNYDTNDLAVLAPAVDIAIGLSKGLSLGPTRVGGFDVLLNGAYIPEGELGELSVKAPNGSFKLGYGARLGILEETIVVPGLSVTYFKRDLPTLDIVTMSGGYVMLAEKLEIESEAWRVTASKSLLVVRLAVGAGQDVYASNADVSVVSNSSVSLPPVNVALTQRAKRTNYFADLSFNLFVAKIVAEVGRVSGGEGITTLNQYSTKADAPRLYGSVGIRIGL